jgi:hypothetical protein
VSTFSDAAGDKARQSQQTAPETVDEGTCVQTLHIGFCDDEAGILDQVDHRIPPLRALRG